jgi:hypothetical protein
VSASQTALSEVEVAKKQGKSTHSTAAASVVSYESDLGKVTKTLEKAKSALVAFQEGPKKFYEALKALAPPAPPAPEPEPEKVIVNESVMAETAPAV